MPSTVLAETVPALVERAARRHVGLAVGVLRGNESVVHGAGVPADGGTGEFRSFVAAVPEIRGGVVVLSNSRRSVDGFGLRLLHALTGPR